MIHWIVPICVAIAGGSGSGFVERLNLGTAELWVNGHRINGPTVTATWTGEYLLFDDVEYDVMPKNTPLPDSTLMGLYGNVPAVREMVASGTGEIDAVHGFIRERDALIESMTRAQEAGGVDSAAAVAKRSRLVAGIVDITTNGITVEFRGLNPTAITFLGKKGAPAVAPERAARDLVERMRTLGGLCFLDNGILRCLLGEEASRCRAQLEFIIAGGDVRMLPDGPLKSGQQPLLDVLRAREGRR